MLPIKGAVQRQQLKNATVVLQITQHIICTSFELF